MVFFPLGKPAENAAQRKKDHLWIEHLKAP
jgi:hypothetical protein